MKSIVSVHIFFGQVPKDYLVIKYVVVFVGAIVVGVVVVVVVTLGLPFCLLLFSYNPVLYALSDAFIPEAEECRLRND